MLIIETPANVRLKSKAAYVAALESWAAKTMSNPEPSWKDPGTYRYGGFQDNEGRPMATLEKIID